MEKDWFKVKMTVLAADYLFNRGYHVTVGSEYAICYIGMDHDGIVLKDKNGYELCVSAELLGLDIKELRDKLAKAQAEVKNEESKKRVYISGPISGHDKGDSEARFQRAEYELISKGYEVFNPMNNGLPFEASTSQHMRRDLNELTREDKPYDAIYLMKKWNHSAGCWTEFKVALAMGLEVLAEQDDVVYRFV